MALLRWYGSPGFFDSGLQLICIFGLLLLIFLLTIPHRFSMGFRFNSSQDYLYSAFYDTIVAKQLHRKLSF